MIKNIIFDFDGVLVDSEMLVAQSFCRYFRARNIQFTEYDFSKFAGNKTVNLISESNTNLEDYPTQVLICGGGRKNNFIFNNLKSNINCPFNKIDDFNFNGDFIESQAFAYLAIRSFLKKNLTYPSTTGVKAPCLGGKLFNKS